jgi:hypothetical protein
MIGELILHLGDFRTGTTAIQQLAAPVTEPPMASITRPGSTMPHWPRACPIPLRGPSTSARWPIIWAASMRPTQ